MKLNRLLGGLGKETFPKKDLHCGQYVGFERICKSSQAFTLIEMMIVVSILALIIGMTTQMANHVVASNNLTLAGESMQDALRAARHLAMAKDRVVEVRFYKTSDPESMEAKSHINSMQTFVFDAENLSAKPFKQIIKFPSGVVLSDNETLSSLVTESRIKKNWQERDPKVAVPGSGGAYVAYTLRFMPDGSTDLDTQKLWFATLHASHETKLPPDNYVTVQVKATRGGIRTLRPN
ncbi:MAG: Verru_Chthon cassette protein D [Verrucomicrobia bacterium]|nr:Verru_Chthon cassette protein D [Verrucomicrobiota bacterium]